MKYFTVTVLLLASAFSASGSSSRNAPNNMMNRELVEPHALSIKDSIRFMRKRNLETEDEIEDVAEATEDEIEDAAEATQDEIESADTDFIDVDADTNSTDTTVTVGEGEDTQQGSSGVASTPLDLRAGAVAAAIVYFLI